MNSFPDQTSGDIPVEELRRAPRFRVTSDVTSYFASTPVRLVDIGATGLQIEHENGFRLGTLGMFTIATEEPVEVRGRVVWSHLTPGTGKKYRSGVKIEDDIEPLAGRLGRFVRANASPDPGSLERKREALRAREESRAIASGAPQGEYVDEVIAVVLQAREALSQSPQEAIRWHNRARYALATIDVSPELRLAPHRTEALAIWEYLDRRVGLHAIVEILDSRS